MSSEEKVKNHQVFKAIGTLGNTTDLIIRDETLESSQIESVERIAEVTSFIKRNLENLDPLFTPVAILNNINKQIQNTYNQLNSFRSNKNVNHIGNAESQIDNALVQLSNLPNISDKDGVNEFVENLASFRKSSGQYLRYLEKDYKKLKENFSKLGFNFQELEKSITEQKNRIDKVVSDYQKQFLEAESQRREKFQNSEQERVDKFNSQIEEANKKLSQSVDDFDTTATEKINDISTSTENLVKNLREKKEEAEKLVNVVANVGMSGGYQKVADQARKTKIFWQVVAIISILGLIGFAIFAFYETVGADFDLGKFGARSFVAVSFGVLAAYSARQADKNAAFERRNRQLELELASIDMYLAKLTEEDQREVKKKLSEKWFGNLPVKDSSKNNSREGTSYDLLKMVLENLSKTN